MNRTNRKYDIIYTHTYQYIYVQTYMKYKKKQEYNSNQPK